MQPPLQRQVSGLVRALEPYVFLAFLVGGPCQQGIGENQNILPASILADAAFDLDFECSKLFSVPHQLAAEDLAHVLTECTDSAEAKEEHEEGSSEDSDSEDNVPFTPVVDGFMDVPTAPVVDGLEEATRLATLYMAAKKANSSKW